MPLQTSGQISFSDIAAEQGVSLTNVSFRSMSATAGFSTPDSISEFYGYSNTDTTPDAVNISNMNYTGALTLRNSNTVTISGIDSDITLRFTVTSTNLSGTRTFRISKNGVTVKSFNSAGTHDETFSDGDTLQLITTAFSGVVSGSCNTTNESDGGASIDTMTFYHSKTGGFN